MTFEIIHNGTVIETKTLSEGSYKVGRNEECDIRLQSAKVSKQHALLVIKGNRAAVVDVGSSNGIFVNGILVKKSRIESGDEVLIGDYKIRISNRVGSRTQRKQVGQVEGNLAQSPLSEPLSRPVAEPELPPQEKLLLMMDSKVLTPFYGLIKTFDWRFVLSAILIVTLVLSVLASILPILRWGKNIATKESLGRAHTVISQVVRENYRILSKTNDFTRLTVEAIETEEGVLNCLIVDAKDKSILAPAKLYNKAVTDVYSLVAIKRILERKEDRVSLEAENGVYIVSQPLYLFSQELNDRVISAIVLAEFRVPDSIHSIFEPLAEAALFAIMLSLIAYYLIYKMITHPITSLQEQVDAALKGENVTITCDAQFTELQNLATVINFSVSRIKQMSEGGAGAVSSTDPEAEDKAYVQAVADWDGAIGDGILLMDKDKTIRFVGHVLEELIGLRNTYSEGQNISDACRDQAFAGTVIDLAENVIQSLGSLQNSQLDINGTSRSVSAIGHKNSTGEIRFILVTVKMSG